MLINMAEILLSVLMLVLGTVSHFLKDLIRIKNESGKVIPFKDYWLKFPYQNTLYAITAISCLVIVYTMGMLNPATAYFIGISANSFADSLGKRTLDKL